MSKTAGYTILKWNGKYGNESEFIVKNNEGNKQSMFTPGRTADMAWVTTDLTASHSDWEDFGNEQVTNLDEVCF